MLLLLMLLLLMMMLLHLALLLQLYSDLFELLLHLSALVLSALAFLTLLQQLRLQTPQFGL